MRILEKFKDFNEKGMEGILSIVSDRNNPIFCCEKCHKYFGFFYYSVRMLSYCQVYDWDSFSFQCKFFVKCRKCGHINVRIRLK